MPDSRFFRNYGPFSVEQIAKHINAESIQGLDDATSASSKLVYDVAPLDTASSKDISFIDNKKYLDAFSNTKAGYCIASSDNAAKAPKSQIVLITAVPYLAYAKVASLFYPDSLKLSADYGDVLTTENGARVHKTATIGKDTMIGSGCYIGKGVVIGNNCSIAANSTIEYAIIGDNVIIHSGVRIGQDGFGFAPSTSGIVKVPQLGRVIIGNNVEIGSNTCIDRGSSPDTVIGDGTKMDNLVQIGHNVKIGRGCIIVSQVGISGSTEIGDGSIIGGQVGIAGHLKIGTRVTIAAKSGVHNDIPDFETYGGIPAMPIKQWRKSMIAVKRLGKRRENEGV